MRAAEFSILCITQMITVTILHGVHLMKTVKKTCLPSLRIRICCVLSLTTWFSTGNAEFCNGSVFSFPIACTKAKSKCVFYLFYYCRQLRMESFCCLISGFCLHPYSWFLFSFTPISILCYTVLFGCWNLNSFSGKTNINNQTYMGFNSLCNSFIIDQVSESIP